MVAQVPSNEEDDPERFPRGGSPSPDPENILQIRVDPEIGRVMPSMAEMTNLMAARDAREQPAATPITQLVTLLRTLGAVSVGWPLDVTPRLARILTPEEQAARRAILEVTFGPDVNLTEAAAAVSRVPGVREAVPVPGDAPPRADEPLLGVDDQDLMKQWYLFRVRAPQAWQLASGHGVVIGDVDYGFRTSHQDLTNIEAGKAFNSHDGSNEVGHGASISHGTAVLGFAGAARNKKGVVGIAFESSLWPIQANAGPGVKIPGDKWGRGIDYILETDSAGRRKVAILEVQTKIGSCYEMRPSTNEAIQQAIAHDVVVVVAAGNGGKDVSLNDAGEVYPETGSILVGATGFHATANPRSCSSNYGPRITVSAPGYGPADITCGHLADDGYRQTFGGTSGAAPKVAGACALMLEVNPSLSHADVRNILVETGSEVLTSPNRPAGVFLNVEAAVSRAR
jgi:subtilisin family serine protease